MKELHLDIWKVGLKFERGERGITGKEEIKSKVDQLAGDDNIRKRVVELKQRATKSVGEGGNSDKEQIGETTSVNSRRRKSPRPYPQTHAGDLSRPVEISRRRQDSLVGVSRAQTAPMTGSNATLVVSSICSHLRGQASTHMAVKLLVQLPI
ncbi:hypothetical protein V6N12_059539 [Hibiscus sabdariffa]|uniref:Uncharacterized protein n=1 Tax=Hibiscus sabdariffa TaxID=183260 RepID=A0ABR2EXY1_9ROSI